MIFDQVILILKMGKHQFSQNAATTYHCIPCKQKYKCKKTQTKKDKERREKQYKESGVPLCSLCNLEHWHCNTPDCTNCCNLNKCNDPECINCKNEGIKCVCALPTDQESFEKLNEVSYICGQLESTESGKLHAQMFMQFAKNTRQTIASAKKILNDDSILFVDYLNGTSDENRIYATKEFNRCKKHSGCKCDFFDLTKICEKCDTTCDRKPVRWGRGQFTQEIVGPFEFGEFRVIDKKESNDLNEL